VRTQVADEPGTCLAKGFGEAKAGVRVVDEQAQGVAADPVLAEGDLDDVLSQAARLYDDAKDEPRSVRLPAGASRAFRKLVNAEREAVRMRELTPFVIPGLLQTKRYAEALLQAGSTLHDPDIRPDSVIATRMERQMPRDHERLVHLIHQLRARELHDLPHQAVAQEQLLRR